jgi:hypothetical protein
MFWGKVDIQTDYDLLCTMDLKGGSLIGTVGKQPCKESFGQQNLYL